ncbi:carboxyl transferase domain protein [[Clostridium] asparagiforme DSM 15981]|uniref:Carboxyl transferase domain protein n=3 Tax=Enterocloster asparagiformis TaxID=333367 RepID=C0D841_9FIRM|nr:carboxyl transferase domain protein [[Clostridium] asparagiforme DSM 15981]
MEDCNMSNSAQASASSRIAALLDENSFVEVGAYITARTTDFNMTEQETPADGVVTGYGTIEGCLVYVYSQDASVLGGSMGEMHAKKISNIYSMAMKMGAPVIGLIDCAGLRLQEATDALAGFGQVYLNQTMASGVIPQISAIFGTCGGGMAVSAAITDFTFMEDKSAKLFVNAPNALKGNYTSKCDTSSAAFQSAEAGLVDFTGDEASILGQIRRLVSILPSNNEDDMSYGECQDDLNRISGELAGCAGDTALALSIISDNNFFMEVKKNYDPSMVTGFIRLNGTTVGCVANRSEVYENGEKTAEYEPVLSAKGCDKAADFINFCDSFNIPVLSLVNVKGYKASKCTEKLIAKAAGRLTYAYANASVPKVTVIVKDALGSAYLTMGSKSIGADVVYAWENAAIGMMDPAEAVKIMYAKEIEAAEDSVALISEKTAQYAALQSSALAAARRGYIDDIIKAGETRQRVIAAFEMLFTKREDRPSKKHGTV